MRGNIGDVGAAAVRLAEGASLGETVDTADPSAWIALDTGAREHGSGYGEVSWSPAAWERTEGGRALTNALRQGLPGVLRPGEPDGRSDWLLTEARLATT
ncbi:hypothetical protein [Streptomyces sp. NRRL B-24085]|uniref:hypothetical protein n=1 Tax=Streptomyces sp. NRRL B-24085 TaxID=1709476 RepID=UPI000B05BFA6|nr:hypothetical protein [Streptomyces sp. NRRL B-24085]